MSGELRYVVEGRPVTWARDNFVKGRFITDERVRSGKSTHKLAASLALRSTPWDRAGLFEVQVVGYWPDQRFGDADRLMTLVMDALEGVTYATDRQVRKQSSEVRLDRERPRVEVVVRRIEGGE